MHMAVHLRGHGILANILYLRHNVLYITSQFKQKEKGNNKIRKGKQASFFVKRTEHIKGASRVECCLRLV